MSEILSRGKTDKGEWVEGFYCPCCFGRFPCSPAIISKEGIDNGCWQPEKVIPETVGQYIGLTDKNGVRIFEKDVISIPYKDMSGFTEYQKALVFWDSERLAWCVKFMNNEVLYLNDVLDPHGTIDIEIVDNIIDNEELVEA